jgi:hypothetical protein
VLQRGWPGRVAQAFIIVSFGVFAGIGYGFVGRPFDKGRTIVWNGLEEWAKERRRAAKAEDARQQQAGIGIDAIQAIPMAKSKATQHAIPSSITHRGRHSRMTLHETRLPLHPPRPAEPPKHPLKEPSIMQTSSFASSPSTPSALAILREHYRKQGGLFASSTPGQLAKRAHAVLSRKQAQYKAKNAKSQGLSQPPLTLESLSEHPALGGTSVFDNLPEPEESRTLGHRKRRFWRSRPIGATPTSAAQLQRASWTSKLTVANVFRVVPPYCFGFLAYACWRVIFRTRV